MPNGETQPIIVPNFVQRAHDALHAPKIWHKAAAVVAAGGLMLGACSAESEPVAESDGQMSAEACAPFQEALAPVYLAESVVDSSKQAADQAEDGSSEQLRAEADKKDAESTLTSLKDAFMQPYDEKVQTAKDKVNESAQDSSDHLRAEADLKDAEKEQADAKNALDGCDPSDSDGTTTSSAAAAAAAGEPVPEDKWHIAGQGSCSPYTAADVDKAKNGELGTDKDLSDVEVEFLQQNPDFARNMALTSEQYGSGYIYEALGIPLPSSDPEHANEFVVDLFKNEYYVTAPLAEDTTVLNSYCDDQGNVNVYQAAILEADTYVGGVIVNAEATTQEGVRSVTLANGKTINLPEQAIVTNVKMADGSVVRMLTSNKAGVSIDGDFEAEFGCENWIITIITPPENPEESTTTSTPNTYITTTTRPYITTTTGPGVKVDDGNIPGPGGNSNTTQPAPAGNPGGSPTTSTTQTPSTPSTTTATAPTTAPQNTTITAPAG